MSVICQNFRKVRKVKGLSQQKFAELLGVTRASIGAYEEGRATPKHDLVIDVANKFSLDLDALMTREITVNEILGYNSNKLPIGSSPTDISQKDLLKYVEGIKKEVDRLYEFLKR